jgi:hypothetical protein
MMKLWKVHGIPCPTISFALSAVAAKKTTRPYEVV